MALNGSAYDQFIRGIVSSVNPKGVKLDGDGSWRNFSKFAEDLVPPMRGQSVTLTLDRQGFVRAITSTDGSEPSPAAQSAPQSSQREGAAPQLSDCVRHRTITRLAVLKAAAEFGAARPNLKSGDVLAIAATWERWVNRDEETTYTLTDAF